MNRTAQKLGRLAAGVPKNYSAEEIARRSKIIAGVNARKAAIRIGSAIYWHRSNGDTVPGIVTMVGQRVRIIANCREGDRAVWVMAKHLTLQPNIVATGDDAHPLLVR